MDYAPSPTPHNNTREAEQYSSDLCILIIFPLMDEYTFQTWMEGVLPSMTQLSVEQTRAFFGAFVERCTVEQKIFLEREIQSLVRRDIMELPPLVVDRILELLDVQELLKLRLVCRSWRHIVTAKSWLWKSLSQQYGAEMDSAKCASDTQYFHLFVSLKAALHQMASNKAFSILKDSLSDYVCGYEGQTCNHIAHGSGVIAVENNGQLLVVDARTKERLLERRDFGSSTCLCISGDMILAGTFWGQLRVQSLDSDGHFQHQVQCGINMVTAVDVHRTGCFTIVGFFDGTVRLIDNKVELFTVGLQLPQSLGDVNPAAWRVQTGKPVDKVFFMPDSALEPGQLAICVCRPYSWSVAVITDTGKVMHQKDHCFECGVQTFCRNSSDQSLLHCDLQYLSGLGRNAEMISTRRLFYQTVMETYCFSFDSSGVSSQCVSKLGSCERVEGFQPSLNATRLLAAGRKFALAASMDDLVVFRLHCGSVVCIVDHFFEGHNIWKLSLNRGLGSMTAVNIQWLNGLSQATTTSTTPIILFGTSDRTTVKSLLWSADLWQHVVDDYSGSCVQDRDSQDVCKSCCESASKIARSMECGESSGGSLHSCVNGNKNETLCNDRGVKDNSKLSSATTGIWRNAALFKEACRNSGQSLEVNS